MSLFFTSFINSKATDKNQQTACMQLEYEPLKIQFYLTFMLYKLALQHSKTLEWHQLNLKPGLTCSMRKN